MVQLVDRPANRNDGCESGRPAGMVPRPVRWSSRATPLVIFGRSSLPIDLAASADYPTRDMDDTVAAAGQVRCSARRGGDSAVKNVRPPIQTAVLCEFGRVARSDLESIGFPVVGPVLGRVRVHGLKGRVIASPVAGRSRRRCTPCRGGRRGLPSWPARPGGAERRSPAAPCGGALGRGSSWPTADPSRRGRRRPSPPSARVEPLDDPSRRSRDRPVRQTKSLDVATAGLLPGESRRCGCV